eukprot:SAG22_NODE_1100_length_5563_cov_24.716874_3_plen_181_part_00
MPGMGVSYQHTQGYKQLNAEIAKLRKLKIAQEFLNSHGLADSADPLACYRVQRLVSLAQLEKDHIWSSDYSPSSYCWDGGAENGVRWNASKRPSINPPTDAELLFELMLPKVPRAAHSHAVGAGGAAAAAGGGHGSATEAGYDPNSYNGIVTQWDPSPLRVEVRRSSSSSSSRVAAAAAE